MSFIEWTDRLSIRVPEMDQQHQKLVIMLNEYYDAIKVGKDRDILGKTLNRVIDYTKTHLNAEERFMESIDYAFVNSHKTEHRRFTDQILQLKTQYDAGDAAVGHKLLSVLRDWLVNHIQKVDRMYGDYYLKQVAARSKTKTTV